MDIIKKIIGSSSLPRKTHVEQSNLSSDDLLNFENSLDLTSLCWSPYNRLSRGDLRLLIFSQGKRLAYDSKTVISVKDRILSDCPKSKCGGFQYLPHAGDTKQIEKMIFGTSSMPDVFKVHAIVEADSLMLSRVFSAPKSVEHIFSSNGRTCHCAMTSTTVATSSDSDSQLNYSTVRSIDALHDIRSNGLTRGLLSRTPSYSSTDPPDGFARLRNASLQLDVADDSAFADPLRTFLPNRISRVRRRQLSLKGLCDDRTSLQNGVLPCRSRMSSCSSVTDGSVYTSHRIPLNSISHVSRNDRSIRSYGIAILFPGDDKEFVFQHILQIESEILNLIDKINMATAQKTNYLKLVYEAWLEFCDSMCVLHNAPRLRTPVWLSLTDSRLQDRTASEFCQRLAKLSAQLNTKESQFFLSTLISTVLMSHLSWVASITPPDNCVYDRSLLLGTAVIDSRQNPYNAKAAQFVELLGGIGFDNPTARTVVFGTDVQLVTEILYVLSYFIRCSSVEKKRLELLTPDLIFPNNFVDDSAMDDADSIRAIAMPIALASHNCMNGVAISSSIGSDGNSSSRSNCVTPPPAKMRAISVSSPMSSPNTAYHHSNPTRYALIVDNKQMANACAEDSHRQSAMAGVGSSHLRFSELDRPTDFGRTLLAGVCDSYSPHFVLSGIDKKQATIEETYANIHRELCNYSDEMFSTTWTNNLNVTSTNSNNTFLSPGTTNRNSRHNVDSLLLKRLPMSKSDGTTVIDPPNLNDSNSPNCSHINGRPTVRRDDLKDFKTEYSLSPSTSLYVDVAHNGIHRTTSTVVADSNSNCDSNSQHSCFSRADTKPSAIVILADSSQHTVKVISGGAGPVSERSISSPSETIASMLEEFVELFKQKCASTFLISFLEDRLGSILLKSNVLVGMINETETNVSMFSTEEKSAGDFSDGPSQFPSTPSPLCTMPINVVDEISGSGFISMQQMSQILDCHCSDLRLILNVASVYAPGVLSAAV